MTARESTAVAQGSLSSEDASRLFLLGWEGNLKGMALLVAPHCADVSVAQRLCARWLALPLDPRADIPIHDPFKRMLPDSPTPWPRSWSPLPGVDLPNEAVIRVAWKALAHASGLPLDRSWKNDLEEILPLRMAGPQLDALAEHWIKARHALHCIYYVTEHLGRPGRLTPREVDELAAITLEIGHRPRRGWQVDRRDPLQSERLTRVWQLLVRARMDPVDAWRAILTWNPWSRTLPTGQWLPNPTEDRTASVRIVAGVQLSEEVIEHLDRLLPKRRTDALDVLTTLAGCDALQARIVIEALSAEGTQSLGETATDPELAPVGEEAPAHTSAARLALDAAIAKVILERPFHWALLSLAAIIEDPRVATMAIGATTRGKLVMFYSPEFVLSITREQCQGVVVHEINHAILGHVTDRAPKPRKRDLATLERYARAWAYACEVTANEFVPYPLPGQPITIERFGLSPGESTLERFKRFLKRKLPEFELEIVLYALAPDPKHHRDTVDETPGSLSGAISVALRAVGRELDSDTAKLVGKHSKEHRVALVEAREVAELPWQTLLRTATRNLLRRTSTRLFPNRRLPGQVGIVPGRRARRSDSSVLAVIDTSPSMTPTELAEVGGELQGLLQLRARVAVLHCDTEIRKETWLQRGQSLDRVWGRGGTSFAPPFRRQILEKYQPGLLVYFTDGHGEAPTDPPPNVEVLWILTGKHPKLPARWGRTVCMRESAERRELGVGGRDA